MANEVIEVSKKTSDRSSRIADRRFLNNCHSLFFSPRQEVEEIIMLLDLKTKINQLK